MHNNADGELSMTEDSTRIARLQREVHRLRTSPSLRLGAHITDSIRKPWRAPFLIVTLPWLMLLVGLELIGLKSQPPSYRTFSSDGSLQKRECVVMFPTNGVGFGHFTRMLALAKRMKSKNENLEVIFFTIATFVSS